MSLLTIFQNYFNKERMDFHMKNKYKIPVLTSILVCAFCIFFPMIAMATSQDRQDFHTLWTFVGSAMVPDESSLTAYEATGGWFEFKSSKTGTITARCNVKKDNDNATDFCTPTSMRVVYRDSGELYPPRRPVLQTDTVIVRLIEVDFFGQESVLAEVNSDNFAGGPGIRFGYLFFDNYNLHVAHYIEVSVYRRFYFYNPGVLLVQLGCEVIS